ncbi:MAG: fatty acid kinase fatty acid binding subunit [Acidimicrobiaceae bacterium]|jgi:DegV family protein with EDD domain|nr:fatty acid kinase fatty acid binding subunit [Acidimicrobiaceae bacterium]
MPIRVVTDSACDLPPDLVAELDIDIVPLTIRFGNEELVDGRDLSPKEFWARVASSPVLPETAAPSPGAFEEAFRRAAAAGADGVVCVNLSGALSATFQSASVAARSVADDIPVRVIDSRTVTMALGLMAVAAARAAKQGKGLEDCAGVVEDLVPRTRTYGALDTMENLRKGGRIGSAQALLGSMLSIKPIIEVVDGLVEAESRQRTRSKSLRYLVEKVRGFGHVEDLAVMHGDAPDLDELLDLLGAVYPRDDILVGDIGPVIGTHGGPRVIGVVFHVPR